MLYLVADLPGLAADGTARGDSHLGQLERARVLLHAVDASDLTAGGPPGPRAGGLAAFVPAGAREIVVATGRPGRPAAWADASVEAEEGAGIDALRERLLAALER